MESLEIPQNPVPCQSEIARAGESHCLEVNMKLVRNLWFMQYRPGVNEYPNILPGVNFWDTTQIRPFKDGVIQFVQLGVSVAQPPTNISRFSRPLTALFRRLVKEHSEGSLCFCTEKLKMTGMDRG